MRAFLYSFFGFLLSLAVLGAAVIWFDGQRVAMHKTGQRPTVLYCQIMRTLSYPRFEKGEQWRCETILDEGPAVIMDHGDSY